MYTVSLKPLACTLLYNDRSSGLQAADLVGTRMRDMPSHYKLITSPFIKFHDRCLLRQRALYAPCHATPPLSPRSSSRRYIHYLFTGVYNPSNGDWRNRPPIRYPLSVPSSVPAMFPVIVHPSARRCRAPS